MLTQLLAQKKRPEDVVIDVKSGKVVQGDFGKWEKERKSKLAKQTKIITTANGWELDWNKKSDPTAEDWARLKAWDDQQGPNPKTRPFAKGAQPTTVQATDAEGNVRPSGLLGITDAVNFGNERLGQFAKNLFAPIKGGPHDIMGDYKDPSARIETGELVAGALAAPGEVVGEAGVVLDPNPETTLEQRGKAVLGMLVNGLGVAEAGAIMRGTTLTKSMYSKLVQRFGAKEANRIKNEVAEIGVTFRPAKGAKPVEDVLEGFPSKKDAPTRPVAENEGGNKPSTSIALRESDRYNMRPDEPGRESVEEWAKRAETAGHGTQEGAAKILAKGAEPTAEETIGLSTRLADIHSQLRTVGKGPARQALIDEAKKIRSVRHTETARALASRAVLMKTDYSPDGILAAVEIRTGREPTGNAAKAYQKMADDFKAANEKITQLEKELEEVRKNPPKAERIKYGSGTPTQRIEAAHKELAEMMGRMSANVDPTIVVPIAKLVKAHIDKASGNIDVALKNAKVELKTAFGIEHSTDELWEAFKGQRPKRNVTEDLIRQRKESARIAAAIRNKVANDEASFGGKAARKAASISTEIKMWNPVARTIDQASNLDEAISTTLASPIERPIANLVLKLSKNDARYKTVSVTNRAQMVGRYLNEVKADVREAAGLSEARWQGGGPAGHFAGILDAPARAWHEITWAGERAQHLSKGGDFGDILDQIRDPDLPGPLPRMDAKKLHNDMKDYGDIQMLTNANWASRLRGMTHGMVNNFVPAPLQPLAHFATDITTQFSKVLVNVTDKTAQYSNPYYAAARAAMELMGSKSSTSAEIRAKTFAQILRRGGIGMGLTQLGYWMYQDGKKVPDLLAPAIVETRAKDGDRTGQFYQDDGYMAQLGRMSAALMLGYRQAQIDASDISDKQKDKLRKQLLYAPMTDNPIMSNAGRWAKLFDSGNPAPEQTLYSWLAGLYWPGGANEWAKVQDKQEGVFGRRAEGFLQEFQKRTPTVKGKPPKLPSKTASVRR